MTDAFDGEMNLPGNFRVRQIPQKFHADHQLLFFRKRMQDLKHARRFIPKGDLLFQIQRIGDGIQNFFRRLVGQNNISASSIATAGDPESRVDSADYLKYNIISIRMQPYMCMDAASTMKESCLHDGTVLFFYDSDCHSRF